MGDQMILLPRIAGEGLIGSGMLTAGMLLRMAEQTATTPPEQAIAAIVQAVGTALAAGGLGYFLIQTGVKQWVAAKEAQREADKEEREQERAERQRVYDHWQARATEWRLAYEAERKQSMELTVQLLQCSRRASSVEKSSQ
jgi:hypothetical protein